MPPRARSGGATGARGPGQGAQPSRHRIIALGASAGGLNSISQVLSRLPRSLPCGVLVVQHLSPDHKSLMPELLLRRTELPVHQAVDGEEILPGVVYTAPPGQHLLAEPGSVRLLRTPEVHHHRPSIDLLFESVAVNYGSRGIVAVFSGSGADGAIGLRAVKMAGGRTLAEDPTKAEFNSMPYAAIATGSVDLVLTAVKIGDALVELCNE